MKTNNSSTEHYLYGLAFALALVLRLFQLGAAPLSDVEAGWALQALSLAHGGSAAMGPQPAYILLTSQLFSIFGDFNFLARLFPALAGSLIIFLPFLFRRWMGDSTWLHRAGVVMAFGLAIDPGLVSLSRQAGSLVPALVFTLLAIACFFNRYSVRLGIFAGLALLSGLAFLQGLLLLGLIWGLFRLLYHRASQSHSDEYDEGSSSQLPSTLLGPALYAFIGMLLIAGTLFLRAPQGLSGLAATLPAYFNSWVVPGSIPLFRLPAALLVYTPIVLVFAIITIVRFWFAPQEDPRIQRLIAGLGISALVTLLVPLLYAGRQVGDVAWALIPLWALAALEISRALLFDADKTTYVVAAGLGFFLFVMGVLGRLNLLSIGQYQVNVFIYWALIVGTFLLGVIAVLVSAATWSILAARLGVVWGLCILLGLHLFANTWGTSITRQNSVLDLWAIPPTTGQASQLLATLADLSNWDTGLRDQLEIVVLADSPSMQWLLRNFPNARFESTLPSTISPAAVITMKDGETPSLAQKYRGQDFVWGLYPGWQGVFPPSFINWLAFRQAPLGQTQVILWARADIFPGGTSGTADSSTP